MRKPLPLAMATALVAGSALADTPDYSLTIYSSAQPGQISTERLANYGESLPGYALVRDGRKMSLPAGKSELRFTDVAKRIDPTTVAFESLTDPAGTRVIEQNYQYDLVNRDKLLERYVGEKITVELKYTKDHQPVITGLERVSRPGRRRYVGNGEVPRVHGGTGTAIITTSHGVMTGHEAKKEGVGGEVLAYVW